MAEQPEIHNYYCQQSPTFRTSIQVDGKKLPICFVDNAFKTTDLAIAQAFDAALADPNCQVRRWVKKITKESAEGLVARHRMQQQAAKGGMHSLNNVNNAGASETQLAIQQMKQNAISGETAGLQLVNGEDAIMPLETETVSPAVQTEKPANPVLTNLVVEQNGSTNVT